MKVASGNVLWQQRKRNWCRTPFTFTVYTLTDQELSIKTGVLNENFNLIKLFRIVDISVERTLLQRIFGMSTLVLDTRDQSSGNGTVALKNVLNGFEVRKVLQEAVDASRRVNGMSAREFLGGPSAPGFGPGPNGPGFDGDFDGPDMGAYDDGR
ncbi:PH domain-containing protein [Bifidobacterium sp.]|uniref:PH domain-containing protein n=1 Tax=Bifidobacterium sp. TaxID=41200 RepID=UPI003D7CABEC